MSAASPALTAFMQALLGILRAMLADMAADIAHLPPTHRAWRQYRALQATIIALEATLRTPQAPARRLPARIPSVPPQPPRAIAPTPATPPRPVSHALSRAPPFRKSGMARSPKHA